MMPLIVSAAYNKAFVASFSLPYISNHPVQRATV